MTHVVNIGSPGRARDLAGVLCVIAGMTFFVGQDALMKDLLGPYTVWLLMAVRGVAAVLVLVPLILLLGGRHRLLTPLWPLHLLRGSLFAFGFSLFYSAFPFMGLAEVSTIFFAAPLITAVAATLFLGESIGPHRLAALVVGFAGVLVAMAPSGEAFNWVAVLPLLCAAMYSSGQILARYIGDRETTLTTGLYTTAFSSALVLPLGWCLNQILPVSGEFAHIAWSFPSGFGNDWPAVALLGLVGMAGYLLMSRAYQIAPASLVAPFDYTYLPMAALVAWLLWSEVPGPNTMIGMALIIVSGLYLGYRELRQTRKPEAMLPTAEAVYAPGHPVVVPDERMTDTR